MTRALEYLNRQSKLLVMVFGIALLIVVGVIDYLTGTEVALAIAYLIPISLITWYIGGRAGLLMCVASAIIWFVENLSTYSSPLVHYWNGLTRLGLFLAVTYILLKRKKGLENERKLARTDSLTRIADRKSFYESANTQLGECLGRGRPLTIAYFNVDNFKTINDNFGHSVGDTLLCQVAETLKDSVQPYNTVARLGGDEFAVLSPDTGPEKALMDSHKMQMALLTVMKANNWPVTYSIGVATYTGTPHTVDELVGRAHNLMRAVKGNGKNMIKYEVFN